MSRALLSKLSFVPLSLALALAFTGNATAGPEENDRARNAVRVLNEVQRIPESAIPDKLFDEARAIVVVPDTLKVGLVLGGRRGHGVVSVKNPDGSWSNPSFVKLTGGSIGFQAGVQSSDIVLVFRGERGLDSIVNGKITLGADAGVAAGPVGRNAATATDGQLKAEIWSWSRARGLFAGIALDGAVLSIDDAANQLVYGEGTTPRMIFEGRTRQPADEQVVDFRDTLEEASALARERRGARAATPPVAPAAATTAPAQPPMPATGTEATPAPFQDVPADSVRTEPLPAEPVPPTPRR
ncbi:lipid-binding SYLF domain-containing protein [Lysobacter solisilvae (ex Woo and Kim 2020)]|uniref:Lipid-binding SYLF domain-containing protein n=1 Tax=Agrilutibacter terrestris TaxID=2865112 RepID=A0A7H0FTU1_9GAMM|nr:lipid-binding SYLF domain-containing protein [Lysobacter terrestris]QNP39457.1 lipid-binding SYLF domain-containing protein [Lysobacter terrestris]